MGSCAGAPRAIGACGVRQAASGERAQIPFTCRFNPKLSGREASPEPIWCAAMGSIGRIIKVRPFRSRPLTRGALRYWRIFRLVYLCTM